MATAVHPLPDAVRVMFEGQFEITGPDKSATVTVCVCVISLPPLSVTRHNTLVIPTGYCAGALLVIVNDPTGQLSVITGVPKLTPVA